MTRTNRECITFVFRAVGGAAKVVVGLRRTLDVVYSVLVITKDSESFDPGSSSGRTFFRRFGPKFEPSARQRRSGMPECPRGLRGQT